MPEKPTYQSPERSQSKTRTSRSKSGAQSKDEGIYLKADNTAYILKYAVPVLAETLGAKEPSFRAMVGKVGSLTRATSVYTNKTDRVAYDVFVERSLDIDSRGKKIGRVTLQIVISHYHQLDEAEVIAEWPLIEEVGAADDLLIDVARQHVSNYDIIEEIDIDDPAVKAQMMQGQSDYLSELDFEDEVEEETMTAALVGSEIDRYFEKKLRLTTGIRPSLSFYAGYQTDETSYAFKLEDGYNTRLIGETPAELSLMAQLNTESFRLIDSTTMQEFIQALEVVGILARSCKETE